jgi:4-amino-4-deoxy-L-arabinose transferase-like glycosyltransferase
MRRFAPSAEPAWTWRTGVLLFVVVLLLAVPQAALLPLLDRDEPRFAEASREMLQSGNFVVPTFDHAPRYAKPPLIYWAQAGAFKVFGENA